MSPPTVTLAAFIQCQRLLGQCASNDITHHDPITRRLEKQPYQHRIKSTQFNSTCILHQKPQPSEVRPSAAARLPLQITTSNTWINSLHKCHDCCATTALHLVSTLSSTAIQHPLPTMRYNLIQMILRSVALLMTLLLTALIGNVMASNIDAAGSATAAVNFIMFIAVVCWVVCIVGLLAFFVSALDKPLMQLPLDGIAVLFTFIGAIVLAAKLRVVNCGDINPKALPGDWIAWGSASDEGRCRRLQASTVFIWFLFACVSGSLFLTIRTARNQYGSLRSAASRPSMSQISSSV
ncbi:hypothetical protein FOBRF1_002329 [Fusarium oxysporum]